MLTTKAAGLPARALRLGTGVLLAVPLAIAAAAPAQAADTVACKGAASVFGVDAAGVMWRYSLNGPATATTSWTQKVQLNGGWKQYGRVLGGPDGRMYGIKADGVYRYRYNGSGWDTVDGKVAQHISTGFSDYGNTAYRDKITIDEAGNFYVIDATGRLRWYRYDEQSKTWPVFARVLETGWDRYNLIVSSTVGTLLARQPDGKLFRYRFDPVSQRRLEAPRQVRPETGWALFTRGLLSAGGDTVFGIKASGDFVQYRYREDNNTWPVNTRDIGNGWQSYTNVIATTNTCTLTANHSPARPSLAPASNTAVSAVQAAPGAAAQGDVYYSFTNAIGRLITGRQNPDSVNSLQWVTEDSNEAFTARPTLLDDGKGVVNAFVQNINSDLWTRRQTTPGGPTWTPWLNLGGAMVSSPTAVRRSDNSLAVFGTAADGTVWARSQDVPSGGMMPWKSLGGTGLTGALTAVAVADRTVVLLGVDANGAVLTARFKDGALTAPWRTMGGTGLVGTPAAVLLPGYLLRVFARTADGHIVTQLQDAAGGSPGVWLPVGDDDFVGTGSPSALLNPETSKVMVFSRSGDDMYYVDETGQGSATWGARRLASNADQPVASDPVAITYRDSNGTVVGFVVRNTSGGASLWQWHNGDVSASASKAGAPGAFRARVLPAVPRS